MSNVALNGSHDLAQRSSEIRLLVAGNELPVAIRKLMDFVRDFSGRNEDLDESTVMSMEWRQIEDGVRCDDLDFAAASVARKRLARQLLGLLRVVEESLMQELARA